MVGDSKVPRMSIITTTKFSQSILTFKILSCKRTIHKELKKQQRRRCVYVSKASSSLFVDYKNRKKKKRMAERMQESMEGMTKGYIGDLPRISAHVMINPLPWLNVHPLDHNVKKAPISNKRPPSFLNFFNSLTPKISWVILLAVSHAVLVMLVWRIWYWIHFYSPYWYFFVILITCLLDIVLIL